MTSDPRSSRSIPFNRAEHAAYIISGLGVLAGGYVSLDASRPWLCYWITHSLELLGPDYGLAGDAADDVAHFLSLCQSTDGGFAGGPVPGQSAHLAPTYAAINALVTIGTATSLGVVDRKALKTFLRRMKVPGGASNMHDDAQLLRVYDCVCSSSPLTWSFPLAPFGRCPAAPSPCMTMERPTCAAHTLPWQSAPSPTSA